MNTRIQGTVCLTVGLLGLAGYLFSSGGAADYNVLAAPSTSPVLVPFADDSWQVTYWGSSTKRLPSESSKTSWTVTLFGLPKDAEANRMVLVSCVGQPLTSNDWGTEPVPQSKGIFVFQVDSGGELQEIITPHGFDLTSFPIDLLLHPNPNNRSPQDFVVRPSIGLSKANQLSLQEVGGSLEERTYNVVGKIVSLAIEGGERRVQLSYNPDASQTQNLDAQTHYCEQGTEVRSSLKLRWGHTSQITQDRVAAIRKDLSRWFEYSSRIQDLVGTASFDVDFGKQAYSLALPELFADLKGGVPLCLDPLTKSLLSQFTTSPGITYYRVQLGHEALRRLRSDHRQLGWQATDVNGNLSDAADFLDKVTVMGFVFAGKNETLRAAETLCELRRKFSACDVEVLAFSIDREDSAQKQLTAGFDENIPVLDGRTVASELRLFECGVPIIIVCDRQGKPKVLHACQGPFTNGILADQVRSLVDQTELGEAPPESMLSNQAYDSSLPRGKVDRFDHLDTQASFVSVD